ncbi:MAG: DJ-1/PfpI family protein [Bacteroidetes bacterium]|nr:DJ-1/PfpI family protein [Bacteroidota bacterium]
MKYILALFFLLFLFSCQPIKEFHKISQYSCKTQIPVSVKHINPELSTIVILASNSGTEIFDLLAPFYIFSSTQQFNVLVVAPEKKPFLLWKGVFAMPHFSISEIQHIDPALIVIPALNNPSDSVIISYLKSKQESKKLSVCEGSRTLAQAGLLDNIVCTSHASSINDQKKKFPEAKWQTNLKYTEHHNIYTTAGVASAIEGSLYLVRVLSEKSEMEKVMCEIQYPHSSIHIEHNSGKVRIREQLNILSKTWFKKNKRIGIFLNDQVDELQLAAILDTYNRTFPSKIETFTKGDSLIVSKHGLQLFPTSATNSEYDEIHISKSAVSDFHNQTENQNVEIINYNQSAIYLFPEILARIENQYSPRFRETVERLLDYTKN